MGHLLAPASSESCRGGLSQLEGHGRAASRVGLAAQQCATVLLLFGEDNAEITLCQGGTQAVIIQCLICTDMCGPMCAPISCRISLCYVLLWTYRAILAPVIKFKAN